MGVGVLWIDLNKTDLGSLRLTLGTELFSYFSQEVFPLLSKAYCTDSNMESMMLSI